MGRRGYEFVGEREALVGLGKFYRLQLDMFESEETMFNYVLLQYFYEQDLWKRKRHSTRNRSIKQVS